MTTLLCAREYDGKACSISIKIEEDGLLITLECEGLTIKRELSYEEVTSAKSSSLIDDTISKMIGDLHDYTGEE
jgi:hypothetical protein